jgi:hypothetical protein
MLTALRLAKEGWYGGDPALVLSAPADHVMLALQYGSFLVEYESEMHRLNRKEN